MGQEPSIPPPGHFDDRVATQLLGKTLLLGITENDHQGVFIGRRQIFGTVTVADRSRGICLKDSNDGSAFWLPPETRGISAARPREYRNRATGEVVTDPDFLGAIVLTKGPPSA